MLLVCCRLRAVDELLSVRRSNAARLARVHEEGMATLSLFEIQQSQERSGDAAARTSSLQERTKLLEARAEALRLQIDDTKCEIHEAYASLLHGSSDDRQRAAKHSAKTALESLWDARGVPMHERSEFMLRIIKRAPFSITLRVMFESELAKLTAAIAEATTTEHTRRLRGFIARLETTVSACMRDSWNSLALAAVGGDAITAVTAACSNTTARDLLYRHRPPVL